MIATRRSFVRRALLALAVVGVVAAPAGAQGKGKNGNGHDDGHRSAASQSAPHSDNHRNAPSASRNDAHVKKVPPGHAKKRHSHDDAVRITRSVLGERGYTVTRVERRGDTRVIYYYRGNNGRGKGHGPLLRMVMRPTVRAEEYTLDGAPKTVLQDVVRRLKL